MSRPLLASQLRTLFVAALLCLGLAARPGSLRADASDASRAAAARAAFEAGVQLADGHDYAAAKREFERALGLRESPVIRFNLATVLTELGQLLEAGELFRALELDPRTSEDLRDRAHQRYEALRPRLARLTVTLETLHDDVTVELDQRALGASELGAAMPIDPGAHELRASRAGELRAHELIDLGEGELRVVSLRVMDPEPVPAPVLVAVKPPSPARPAPAPVDDGTRSTRRRRRLAYGLSGAALVVGGALGAYFAASRSEGGRGGHGDFDPPSVGVKVAP